MQNRSKIILIVLGISVLLTGLSFLFNSNGTFGGNLSGYRGFPGHFYEFNRGSTTILWSNFFSDVIYYIFFISAFLYLIKMGFKGGKWWPLIIVIVGSITFLLISLGKSSQCVAGFPIEFYVKCEGEGNIGASYILFGLLFDYVFCFSIFAILISSLFAFFDLSRFKSFLIHRDMRITFIGACITFTLFTLLQIIGSSSEKSGLWIVGTIIFGILSLLMYFHYRKKPENEGRKLFFSKLGYTVLGINLALILISTVANLFYEPGWFDFRDFGFAILSYPLIIFIHFQPDPEIFFKRIILYLICFANLSIITFIFDLIGLSCIKIYNYTKNIINIIKK